jgi:hypothetical protein
MDYINKTGKGNYAVRSNPIGDAQREHPVAEG